jgi:hypothetical protein
MKIDRLFTTIFSKNILTTKQFLEAIFYIRRPYFTTVFWSLKIKKEL